MNTPSFHQISMNNNNHLYRNLTSLIKKIAHAQNFSQPKYRKHEFYDHVFPKKQGRQFGHRSGAMDVLGFDDMS